jgi:ABC-type multidrug transport system ATPase subunit
MSNEANLGILWVQVGQGGQDAMPIDKPFVKVGRGRDNDIVLRDPKVSGHHAQFIWGRTGWLVEDLGSSNGTYLNGQRLGPGKAVALQPDDLVRIDEFTFRIAPPRSGEKHPPHLDQPVQITPEPTPGLAIYRKGEVDKVPLVREVVNLGRGSDNDIRLRDPLVSGHHARLEREGSSYRIIDLDSKNGLTYQGERVSEHLLADGDVLHITPHIALQFRSHIGFLPGSLKKRLESPETQYLDMRSLPHAGRQITIGRHSSNVLQLRHPRVSRYHAIIERFGTNFRLRDLNSDNGTFVNGKRVEKETWIREGDELRIASYRLIFQEDGITHFDEAGHLRLDALRVEKWYSRDVNILKRISLSIYPKEFVTIVGASGAGKSTLLNALTGFSPANGPRSRVLVNGKDLYSHIDEYRSEMGYVPQEDIIHRELTVFAALDYAAQLRMPADTSKEERHERIAEVLRELGLERQRDQPINALSGGQRKRVSIGVELLTKPALFFLDEATSGLDPGTETEMMELLRELADGGRTVILVTHATKNVMMCDQVVFLTTGGYLAYYGPPNEALKYFEQYRTAEERRYKEQVEFDDIYRLLATRGKPQEWAQRFRRSAQYREYVVNRLRTLKERRPTPQPLPRRKVDQQRRVSAFRQFQILSARNLRILAQDKVSLALMLAVAPMIGLMDFMWGKEMFDTVQGDAQQVIMMYFMMGLIGVLTGALSSVREIVKEEDIYLRERTVVLKLLPYVLSKVWVGVILAAYQSAIFLLSKWIFADPPGSYTALFMTLFLCTLSGYMIGLAISAASPNQNVALFLVVIVLVPQFLFAGAMLPRDLIPGGQVISAATSTRWAFEALLRNSDIGADVASDPCWQLPESQWDDLDQEDKDRLGCRCMGARMFEECDFPGIRSPEFFDDTVKERLRLPEPVRPGRPTTIPSPTPLPTPKPPPTPGLLGNREAYAQKVQQMQKDYQQKTENQMRNWSNAVATQAAGYEQAMDGYQEQSEEYGEDKSKGERAIQSAEAIIKNVYQDFGDAFVGPLTKRWVALIIISTVVLGLTVVFQKRKDVI